MFRAIFTIFLLALGINIVLCQAQETVTSKLNKQNECSENITYKVWRSVNNAPHKIQMKTIYLSVTNDVFVKEKMICLAKQLNEDYSNEEVFGAIILDDEDIAQKASPIYRREEYLLARRGYYFINRKNEEQYIAFSSKRGQSIFEIKVNLPLNSNK